MKYYLAYGSNLNVAQMSRRCPDAAVIGTGVIKDYRLAFRGSKTGNYLTIEKATGCNVPVAVWGVSDADIEALDAYEGYPVFYTRKTIRIDCETFFNEIKSLDAFVYIMEPRRPYGYPTRSYFCSCWDGYIDFGLDTDLLYEAIEYTEFRMKNK